MKYFPNLLEELKTAKEPSPFLDAKVWTEFGFTHGDEDYAWRNHLPMDPEMKINGVTMREALERFPQDTGIPRNWNVPLVVNHVLPEWWWTTGYCSVSSDASMGPDVNGVDSWLLKDRLFDEGFHHDLPNPSTPAMALLATMIVAYEARTLAIAS